MSPTESKDQRKSRLPEAVALGLFLVGILFIVSELAGVECEPQRFEYQGVEMKTDTYVCTAADGSKEQIYALLATLGCRLRTSEFV